MIAFVDGATEEGYRPGYVARKGVGAGPEKRGEFVH